MQINDNETLIKILDCSFTTPPRPSISNVAIKLIKSLLRRDPSSRLSVSRVLDDSWFNGQQYDSTQTTVAEREGNTCSLSSDNSKTVSSGRCSELMSPSKENISTRENSQTDIKETKRSINNGSSSVDSPVSTCPEQGQAAHINASICRSTIHSFRSKSPSSVNEVHDRVIAEMITQKMCPSRECIERAIRLARGNATVYVTSSSPSHRSPCKSVSPPAALGELASVSVNDVPSSCNDQQQHNLHAGDSVVPTTEVDLSFPHCNDSYIMATYNLLKDKIMREIQGIPLQLAAQEFKSGPKRGHSLPGPRKRGPGVSQAPRFGRPNASSSLSCASSSSSCQGKGLSLDEPSLRAKLQEEESLRAGDFVPEDECVTLPLQRKCSIVSEEGSCELSGRLSDTGSDVHVLLVTSDDRKVSSVPIIANKVGIVITDISASECLEGDQTFTQQTVKSSSSDHYQSSHSDSPIDLATEVDLNYSSERRLPVDDCDALSNEQGWSLFLHLH